MRLVLALILSLTLFAPAARAQDVAELLNALRAQERLKPLKVSPRLEAAANRHAMDMAQRGFFSHQGSDGSSVGQRVRAQGYRFCKVAENIAKGQKSLNEVMTTWAESPGHRRNMLLPDIREFGLVRAPGNIWVLVLGRSGC